MSFLPPQAYTKETLSKAFDWLQYQPDQVKQVAVSPDVLVGLFLKAQRQGLDHIDVDAPVSSKRFLSDLKNLKKDMAQFDDGSGSTQTLSPPQVMSHSAPSSMQNSVQTQVTQTTTVSETKSMNVNSSAASLLGALDAQSLQSIRIVQERFNLSTPQEALRMIVAVGTKQIAHWP